VSGIWLAAFVGDTAGDVAELFVRVLGELVSRVNACSSVMRWSAMRMPLAHPNLPL
jgi:hypothetical protein